MTDGEARSWLENVSARVMHHPELDGSDRAWATIIHTPASHPQRSLLILAFGRTLSELADNAAERWDEAWTRTPGIH